jgi:hypothetical protein
MIKLPPVRTLLLISLLISVLKSSAQNGFENWNINYAECSVDSVLKYEIEYADSVTTGQIQSRFYTRMDSYRFSAIYLGRKRKIEKTTIDDLKVIYRLNGGSQNQMSLLEKVRYEYLFTIEGKDIWLPVQSHIERKFRSEIKPNSVVYLYCLFFNLYVTSTGVGNWFLVSEFHSGTNW